MHIRDVIVAPVISEKSHGHLEVDKYTFKVAPTATKIQIRKAVEKIFNVDVEKVNVMNNRAKRKTLGRYVGSTTAWKKAIVTVKKGQKINEFFEGM